MNIVDDNLHVLFDTHFVDVLLADELLKILNKFIKIIEFFINFYLLIYNIIWKYW